MSGAALGITRSIMGQPWHWRRASADMGAENLAPDDLITQLLLARGVTRDDLDRQRTPTLRGFMPDPSLFRDMDAAAAGDAEHQSREAQRAEDEVGLEVDALHRRMRQQRHLRFPPSAADRDLFAQVGPAVEARAEQRSGADQHARDRTEPAEGLPQRDRDKSADRRARRADQPAERDDAVAALPWLAGVGAQDRDFGEYGVDRRQLRKGDDLMIALLLAVAREALKTQFVPAKAFAKPAGDDDRRLHAAHRRRGAGAPRRRCAS